MQSAVRGPDITVASGQTDSPAMMFDEVFSDARQLAVASPATLPETATIQVSLNFDVNYKENGTSLAAATAAATWITAPAGAALGAAGALANFAAALILCAAFRIHLSVGAGANRTFVTYKLHENV